MIRLLPADQLWDRYRVDAVGADPLDGAWLSLLPLRDNGVLQNESSSIGSVLVRHLLIPLERPTRHPLSELLFACARAGLFDPLLPKVDLSHLHGRRRRKTIPPVVDFSDSALPFLGRVKLLGRAEEGGIVILAVPQSSTLAAVALRSGGFSPAQSLRGILACLKEVVRLQEILQARKVTQPERTEAIWTALGRHMLPTSLALRSSDSRPMLNVGVLQGLPIVPPLFELPTNASLLERIVQFFVMLGAPKGNAEKPSTSPSLIAYAALHENFKPIFARFLNAKTGVRVESGFGPLLGKLIAELQILCSESWAGEGAPCISCDFWLKPVTVLNHAAPLMLCPCCGQEQSLSALHTGSTEISVRPSKRSGHTTSILRRDAAPGLPTPPPPQVPVPQGMILIPAGTFLSGERKVPRSLRTYAIDVTPVTEGDYKRYLAETHAKPREGGPSFREPKFDRYPVTNIIWREANDYAEHYGKRIPTLYEWEKAARGTDGRKFPWGNNFHATCGRLRSTQTDPAQNGPSPVGSFPDGASPYGILDMAGNVLEWTCSARRAGERLFRAVKGACFRDGSVELARCTSVQYLHPEMAEPFIGFRCVKDVE